MCVCGFSPVHYMNIANTQLQFHLHTCSIKLLFPKNSVVFKSTKYCSPEVLCFEWVLLTDYITVNAYKYVPLGSVIHGSLE